MCFVLVAFRAHVDNPLVIAANRDEYFDRPAVAAHWWRREVPILAGRDESAGGTWFGVGRDGRFAVVTNRRVPAGPRTAHRSRGELVLRALDHDGPLAGFHRTLAASPEAYNPFNLLYGDTTALYFYDNHHQRANELAPGVYALSNAFLDTPWPKVEEGRRRFTTLIEAPVIDDEALFMLLADGRVFADERLPDTGLEAARERALSAIFIDDGDYGTRCSTVLCIEHSKRVRFAERSHAGVRRGGDRAEFCFDLPGGGVH